VLNIDRVETIEAARELLDRYAVPIHIVEEKHRIKFKKALAAPKTVDVDSSELEVVGPVDPVVQVVQELFTDLLQGLRTRPDGNFFHLRQLHWPAVSQQGP
jgi:hypothetical protein